MNQPEQWVVVKLNKADEIIYKVFGTWRGGYVSSDSWRLNSGIVHVKETGDYYDFIGHSGSIYHCHKKLEGRDRMGPYLNSVLDDILEQSQGEIVEALDFITNQCIMVPIMYISGKMLFATLEEAVEHYFIMLRLTGIEIEIQKVIDDD